MSPQTRFPAGLLTGLLLSACTCLAAGIYSPETGPLDIPHRTDLQVDASLEEWDAGPYTPVRLFSDEVGRRGSVSASVRLAWSDKELLVGVSVVDDVLAEAPGFSLWQGDAFVLAVAGGPEGDQRILFMLTPGVDKHRQPIEPRTLVSDRREDPALAETEFTPHYATRLTEVGYEMEVAFPFAEIGYPNPQIGDRLAVQMEVKDREEDAEQAPRRWRSGGNFLRNPAGYPTIRLSESADERPQLSAVARIVDETRADILLFGDTALAGRAFNIRFPGNRSIDRALHREPGSATATARASIPWIIAQPDETDTIKPAWAEVILEGRLVARFDLNESPWVDSRQGFAPIPSLGSMRAFEADREAKDYPANALLVIGSSSIRFWDSIHEDLAPWPVIQRGFGGSAMADVVGAYRYLVSPYETNRILIYEGDNEAGRAFPESFIRNARTFIERVQAERPEAIIAFLTPKPSPRRFDLWNTTYRTANEGLAELVAKYPDVHLIDVASPLFHEDGTLIEGIFRDDGVHLNEAGYDLWEATIQPRLREIFGEP